jgi:putative FmdB family regulatory protein
MANYEYKCNKCGVQVTIERKMTEEESVPRCDCGEMMARMWSANAVIFNASGFYSTDNKN